MKLAVTEEELEYSAEIDALAGAIESLLAGRNPVVISAVLATLLARLLCACPRPGLRPEILEEHLGLMNALIELHDLQALGRETN
jgi:hypothetical protein